MPLEEYVAISYICMRERNISRRTANSSHLSHIKTGKKLECEYYRGNALLHVVYRIFTDILE
jgi:hypothetical protein